MSIFSEKINPDIPAAEAEEPIGGVPDNALGGAFDNASDGVADSAHGEARQEAYAVLQTAEAGAAAVRESVTESAKELAARIEETVRENLERREPGEAHTKTAEMKKNEILKLIDTSKKGYKYGNMRKPRTRSTKSAKLLYEELKKKKEQKASPEPTPEGEDDFTRIFTSVMTEVSARAEAEQAIEKKK